MCCMCSVPLVPYSHIRNCNFGKNLVKSRIFRYLYRIVSQEVTSMSDSEGFVLEGLQDRRKCGNNSDTLEAIFVTHG